MRKFGVTVLLLFLLTSFVFAAEPKMNINNEDYEKILNATEKIPLDDEGKVDSEKLNQTGFFVKTRAEERIEAINLWMKENVSWMSFILRMVPEVSWTFLLNIYMMVVYLTYCIFRTDFMRSLSLGTIQDDLWSRVFGTAFFLILLFSGAILYITKGIIYLIDVFWNVVLPYGIIIAIILIIAFAALVIFLAYFFPQGLAWIFRMIGRLMGRYIAADAQKSASSKAKKDYEDLKEEQKEEVGYLKTFVRRAFRR